RALPWTASEANCPKPLRSFSFPSLSTGYILLSDGSVFTTGDGGYYWQPIAPLPGSLAAGGTDSATDIAFTSRLEGVALLGDSVVRTTDGGATWLVVASTSGSILRAIDFGDGLNGLAVGDNGKLLRTTDSGASFTELAPGPDAAALALSEVHCLADGVCAAHDSAGASAVITSGAELKFSSLPASLGASSDVMPTGAQGAVAVGAGGNIHSSNDAGTTWQQQSRHIAGTYRGIKAGSKKLAFAYGDNGVVARTTDGGQTWADASLSTTRDVIDVSMSGDGDGFILDEGSFIYRFEGGRQAWQVRLSGAAVQPKAIFSLPKLSVLLVGSKGMRIWKIGEGDFIDVVGVRPSARLSALDSTGNVLVAFGDHEAYLGNKTAKSWRRLTLPPTNSIVSLDFVNTTTGYILDKFGELWFTEDAGKGWRRIDSTGDNAFSSIAFSDQTHGYLASSSGRILRTEDGGSSWARQFPYFDEAQKTPLAIEAASNDVAFGLAIGTNKLLATLSGGQAGAGSGLGFSRGNPLTRRVGQVQVKGQVTPSKGGETVTILARAKGSKPGTKWVSRTVIADANGKFASLWKISRKTVFVARWSGDATRESAGAVSIVIDPKQKKSKKKTKR
ncbi:MAG: hypothetical protein JHC87_09415, partial [Thermoleophilaceae bacterium]|nr:hypothetical protein [Thermoleophilaceae bacterium]